ncbi:MAG: hypothetical protein ACRD1C_02500 [Terriglobales bacterium]
MECVDTNTATVAWAELDREWSEFWTAVEAHAHDPAVWFTPAHTSQLQRLLQRGAQWRREAAHTHEEQGLYACHLRRLEPVLHDLQRAFSETAEQLLHQRQQIHAAREWAHSQNTGRGAT